MSDLQTCLASFAVAAGTLNERGLQTAERDIDTYLDNVSGDRRAALLSLKSAFETMRLDGHVAAHINSTLDRRLAMLA